MLELVDRISLSFIDIHHERSSRSSGNKFCILAGCEAAAEALSLNKTTKCKVAIPYSYFRRKLCI